jgi:hypothetical protein
MVRLMVCQSIRWGGSAYAGLTWWTSGSALGKSGAASYTSILETDSVFRNLLFMMFGWNEKQTRFAPVPSEDSEEFLTDAERPLHDAHSPRRTQSGLSWSAAAILIFLTSLISAGFGAWAARRGQLDADAFSIRHSSQHCKHSTQHGGNVES